MCGILGVIAKRGLRPSLDEGDLLAMRDTMVRRGPDGAGLLLRENMALGHRRLAILDTSEAGSQPMSTEDDRFHLVYNGELYNDAELRAELRACGAVPRGFQSECDSETVLLAFATWGPEAFGKMRGMFALGIYDTVEHRLHLARDPLGLKPLYLHLAIGGVGRAPAGELTFASDPSAILRHPGIDALPDFGMASAYLTTLRSVLGRRTLFHGVESIQPGERAVYDAKTGKLERHSFVEAPVVSRELPLHEAESMVRDAMQDSLARHLRSDVPICSLLSGGLDSTILCRLVKDQGRDLQTWCAGGPREGEGPTDFEFARAVADELGTDHHEVELSRESFAKNWEWMIHENGLPLSTPNEVAIYGISQGLREAGQIVTVSGEGADELFGGYELAMQAASDFVAGPRSAGSGGSFQLESAAWISLGLKPHVLAPDAWQAASGDAHLIDHYETGFRRIREEVGPEGSEFDAHLRFLRHVNLTGLVQRLDTASMLASVEGRTPFADWEVARLAEAMPMSLKFEAAKAGESGAAQASSASRGKRILRSAWEGKIPRSVIQRSKHSFPIPFQDWIRGDGWRLETSPFARVCFNSNSLREVAQDPGSHWQLAWPMMNLAMWGDRWWGQGAA